MFYAKVVTAVLAWVALVAYAMPWLIDQKGFHGAISAAVLTLILMWVTWKMFAESEEEQAGCKFDHECYDPRCRNGCVGSNPDAPEGQKPAPPASPPSCGTGGCC